ncbi:hypothetical protein KJ785_00395, partial [Patescibacteria group bacterium]|nr:hypothetical protein [Patescibacteria group bacterium]
MEYDTNSESYSKVIMRGKLFSIFSLLLFLILVISISIFVLNPKWEIAGDGHGYYMYLRSLAFDGDFNFMNEYGRYDGIYGTDLISQSISPVGRSGNPFAIGESILLTPFFFFALVSDYFLNLSTIDLSGFGIYYQLFLGLGSIFYTLLGSVFLFKALKMFFSV